MSTYTISKVYYRSTDGHPQAECVVFVIKNSSGVEKFCVEIRRRRFQSMNNQQVMDRIEDDCVWWDRKITLEGGGSDYEPTTVFNTRIASFINQEIVT